MRHEIYRVFSIIDNSTILTTSDYDEAVEAAQYGGADVSIESDYGEADYFRELGAACARGDVDELEVERWMDEQNFSDY